jgi:cyclophilin family peptidyl-prolyl cis-trans isomerase/tetratricopeptide (TPR) repeat protein
MGFTAVTATNMRIVQADMVYKRGKPFDEQGSRNSSLELWDNAIAIYEKAIELAPLEDFYYLFLGRAYLERSFITQDPAEQRVLLDKAEARLLAAQAINPLNTDHTANLARLNTRLFQISSSDGERQERLQEAEKNYQEALALSPQNSLIRNEYARLAYDLKQDCTQAIDLYDESAGIDPNYSVTYFARADVYVSCAVGQSESIRADYYSKAAASLEQGLGLDEDNPRAWLQAGQIYQQLGNFDQALAAYSQIQAHNSDEQIPAWNIDYLLATVYLAMGNEAEARRLANQALAAAPAEAGAQIQNFLDRLSSGDPITRTTVASNNPGSATTSTTQAGERPLAVVPPASRNAFYETTPPFVIDTSKNYEAIFSTAKGEMRFTLFDDEAPLTVNNFIFLATQGFYDGTTFHRVLADFMAQGGDPTGTGGGGPGYQFDDETENGLVFDRPGLLAMANAGPDTNGSQFFITFVPTPWLDGRHTIFGQLTAGDDVLGELTRRDPNARPDFSGDLIERIDIVEVSQ